MLVAGALGFVAHAALSERGRPSTPAAPKEPAPGLLTAPAASETPPAVSSARPSASSKARVVCEPTDCVCLRSEATFRLEADALGSAHVLASLEQAPPSCAEALRGPRVEALARVSRCAEVRSAAEALRETSQGHAEYALALCAYRGQRPAEARELAELAVARGRQAPGHLLLGILALEARDLAAAEASLRLAGARAPHLAEAQYNLGLVMQERGRYNDARTAYLAALAAEPRYHDARYQLVLLTARGGALLEARHHLERLRTVLGAQDERVRSGERLVQERAASNQQALTMPGSR